LSQADPWDCSTQRWEGQAELQAEAAAPIPLLWMSPRLSPESSSVETPDQGNLPRVSPKCLSYSAFTEPSRKLATSHTSPKAL